jgi:hypothetical protein
MAGGMGMGGMGGGRGRRGGVGGTAGRGGRGQAGAGTGQGGNAGGAANENRTGPRKTEQDPIADAEQALKTLRQHPDDRAAADALERALRQLKENRGPKGGPGGAQGQ